MTWALMFLSSASIAADATATAPTDDPYAWLEDVTGDRSMEWVNARNAASTSAIEDAGYAALHDRFKAILDSDQRIPYVTKIGDSYYNFWQDGAHERGIWRRTSLEEYKKPSPAWETVIDLDALDKAEDVPWVWHGADCLAPEYRRCLVALSRGGSDADVKRELDLVDGKFVEGGFTLPEAKSEAAWIDADTLYVMTDLGEGTMTTSGYARQVREWKRGTPLADAPLVYEGKTTDVSVGAWHDHTEGFERDFVFRSPTFFTTELFQRVEGQLVKVDVPDDASAFAWREWAFVQLRTDWTVGGKTWPAGSLLVEKFDPFMAGERTFEALFTPTARTALSGVTVTQGAIVVNSLDNVRSAVTIWHVTDGKWASTPMPGLPEFGNVTVSAIDPDHSDDVWVTTTDFLTPTTLSLGSVAPGAGAAVKLRALPAFFNADGLEIQQHEATSADGTKIPYFQVSRKGLKLKGKNPTLLYGYGGFEVSMEPAYSGVTGAGWLENGGVYVLANIRGGGEFGPTWHEAARKANRHKAYEDFAAVARDLIARKVTRPEHLGAMGGSNGGLLMGNMLVQYPELFGAIVCQVPLLDMKRYPHLLAGASWMDEYGDPDDPEQWKYIQTFSPYQLETADKDYPAVLFTTSTRDDRVHPGHARKLAAKMLDQGKDVYYWEDTEGGHGGAATSEQRATMWALSWEFLWEKLS
jgi:prolyl oligopeptidase